jgi:transcriptional regulator with XRE-family HTH domain
MTTHLPMSNLFGRHLRTVREKKAATDPAFSLRQVAAAVDIEPSYLSKIERGLEPPPGEETIKHLAATLGEDADVLLALAGKVSADLQAIICRRPALFAQLLRDLRTLPNHAIVRLVREVRDGDW